jgi:dihydrofolate reductase
MIRAAPAAPPARHLKENLMMTTSRKITASLYLTLDGVVESPEQWHFPYHNDEFMQTLYDEVDASDAMLLGRRTYETFAAYWPHQGPEVPMAEQMNSTPKYVVSSTLTEPHWQNTTVINRDVNVSLTELKDQPGKNLAITGSATLVRGLLQDGLLDQLTLLLHPLILGDASRRLFDDAGTRIPLELADVRQFATGVLRITYAKAE